MDGHMEAVRESFSRPILTIIETRRPARSVSIALDGGHRCDDHIEPGLNRGARLAREPNEEPAPIGRVWRSHDDLATLQLIHRPACSGGRYARSAPKT